MRRVFTIMMLIVASVLGINAKADNANIKISGDSVVIVTDGDTLAMKAGLLKMLSTLPDKMDDTIYNGGDKVAASTQVSQSQDDDGSAYYEHRKNAMKWTAAIVFIVSAAILLVVICVLIAYYAHRRARYKMIEKAIENNYPLPNEAFGEMKVVMTQQPVINSEPLQNGQSKEGYSQQQTINQQQYIASQPSTTATDVYAKLRWNKSARDGFKLVIAGLCFVLFFLFMDAEKVAAMGLIPVIIGVVKMIVAYYDAQHVYMVSPVNVNPQAGKTEQQSQDGQTAKPSQPTPPPFTTTGNEPDNGMNSNAEK